MDVEVWIDEMSLKMPVRAVVSGSPGVYVPTFVRNVNKRCEELKLLAVDVQTLQ